MKVFPLEMLIPFERISISANPKNVYGFFDSWRELVSGVMMVILRKRQVCSGKGMGMMGAQS